MLQDYAEWLNTKNWSAFCTFTSHRRITIKSARRKMRELADYLISEYGKEFMMFWVAEPFQDKLSYHIHALIKLDQSVQHIKTSILHAWHLVAKPEGHKKHNLAAVEEYDPSKGGNYYVSKYLNREEDVDYDII
jgi:hypothetical protein